jgi:hypothetical protein
MRDPKRIEPIIQLLWDVWERTPDLRLGQIIVNAARPNEGCPQILHVEDDKIARGLEEMLKRPTDVDPFPSIE